MDGDQVDNKLKFSFRNHFIASASISFFAVVYIILIFWSHFQFEMVVGMGVWLLINILPTLYLHIEYWHKNKGEEYEVHFDEIIRFKNGKREVYKVSDIEKIKVYLSPALYRGSNLHFLGIEAYHYARVYLKTGEELIITCLLTPKVEKALRGLRGIKIERKKRLFNMVGLID